MHFLRVFLTSQRTNRNLYTTRRKINAMTSGMKENMEKSIWIVFS